MAEVSAEVLQEMLGLEHLRTRPHPLNGARVQYRFLANTGRYRWGPAGKRRAPNASCRECGTTMVFVQNGQGVVYSICASCQIRWAEWWPARAYEMHQDSLAGWRRAVRAQQIKEAQPMEVGAEQIMTTREAADYLEMSVAAIKYHIYVSKQLKPTKLGHTHVFTRSQLDAFRAQRRGPGRPRAQAEPASAQEEGGDGGQA